MRKIALQLPNTFKHLGSERLEAILDEELNPQKGLLPLEDFIHEGGWPDDSTLQMQLVRVERVSNAIELKVQLLFDEVCSTGCADISRKAEGGGVLSIVFDGQTGAAHCMGR